MADSPSTGSGRRIGLRVSRYRPESDAEPQCRGVRRTRCATSGRSSTRSTTSRTRSTRRLSFRWSCRMGICGSCGMNVEGEPRLTCGTFLVDYAPGPIRVEPLANFPVVRDLVIDMSDFMRKLPQVKPWIIRDEEMSVDEGEYLQTPEELDAFKQFSMCINCMLCYAACPVYGLDPEFIGSGGDRPRRALRPRLPRPRASASASTSSSSTRASTAARSSASAPGSAPSTSTPPAPSSATS